MPLIQKMVSLPNTEPSMLTYFSLLITTCHLELLIKIRQKLGHVHFLLTTYLLAKKFINSVSNNRLFQNCVDWRSVTKNKKNEHNNQYYDFKIWLKCACYKPKMLFFPVFLKLLLSFPWTYLSKAISKYTDYAIWIHKRQVLNKFCELVYPKRSIRTQCYNFSIHVCFTVCKDFLSRRWNAAWEVVGKMWIPKLYLP